MSARYDLGTYGLTFSQSIYDDEFRLVTKKVAVSERTLTWPLLVWTSELAGGGAHTATSNDEITENLKVWGAVRNRWRSPFFLQ